MDAKLACAVLMICMPAQAQSSAQGLAKTILEAWTSGSPNGFAAVYPFREARAIQASEKLRRVAGFSEVIPSGQDRAVLVLSGVPLTGNSGDDTIYGMAFSGVYEAMSEAGHWKLTRPIPLDDAATILHQRLNVSVRPGHGIDVEDRLRVRIKGRTGFAARLNHQAKVRSVRVSGHDVRYQVGGGLFWADLQQGDNDLTLRYSLEVDDNPKRSNSGRFTADFGHVRNQFFWHPAYGFDTEGDQAQFSVTVRLPKEFELTTSLPQNVRVEGADRIVEAKSIQPASLLTLAYDRAWKVQRELVGRVQLELFAGPDFRPEPASIAKSFHDIHGLLARFGEPKYVAVVELRGNPGNAWHFSSNQALFAAGSPGSLSTGGAQPSATFGHEVGHFWTRGSGPAANFLREGWATYVESLVLEQEYGRETMQTFWKTQARSYFDHYDGKVSMWGSGNSSNLNYHKGAWVFRMLEDAVGTSAFQKAMREFSRRSFAGSAGWETLADCFQQQNVPNFDPREFLVPWLKEPRAPRLTANAEGSVATIVQAEPFFVLPVIMEGTTAKGTERHRVWIRGASTEVQFSDTVSNLRIDPDELLLLPHP